MINWFGNLFEGVITPDCKLNGFCIVYNGYMRSIDVGGYSDNVQSGNCVSFNSTDLSIKKAGWY